MTPEERAELRAKAEIANLYTPWTNTGSTVQDGDAWVADCNSELDADFIAAADPPTVLALLDDLEAAEGRLARVEGLVDEWYEESDESESFADELRAALGADDA